MLYARNDFSVKFSPTRSTVWYMNMRLEIKVNANVIFYTFITIHREFLYAHVRGGAVRNVMLGLYNMCPYC